AGESAPVTGIAAEFVTDDVFATMADLPKAGRQFDVTVLDPPKFARAQHAVPEALRGYRRLQKLALQMLPPDGLLVMCCCSGLITMTMLEESLAQVAADAKRDLQLLERRGPAPDHPVAVSCLESGYLKCIIG